MSLPLLLCSPGIILCLLFCYDIINACFFQCLYELWYGGLRIYATAIQSAVVLHDHIIHRRILTGHTAGVKDKPKCMGTICIVIVILTKLYTLLTGT